MAKLYNKSTKQIQLDPIIKETSNRLMQKIIEKDYLLHKKISQKSKSGFIVVIPTIKIVHKTRAWTENYLQKGSTLLDV